MQVSEIFTAGQSWTGRDNDHDRDDHRRGHQRHGHWRRNWNWRRRCWDNSWQWD